MDKGIIINIETSKSNWSIKKVLDSFWWDLKKGIEAQCSGNAGKWLKRTYVQEIQNDEHKLLKDGFILFFNNPGGMCSASSGVTYHMATLLLAHNVEKFSKRLKQKNYNFITKFEALESIQAKQEILFFDYKDLIYGIQMPVNDMNLIDEHIISDSGLEIVFEELPAKLKNQLKEMIEHKKCACFVCKKINQNKLKYMTFY